MIKLIGSLRTAKYSVIAYHLLKKPPNTTIGQLGSVKTKITRIWIKRWRGTNFRIVVIDKYRTRTKILKINFASFSRKFWRFVPRETILNGVKLCITAHSGWWGVVVGANNNRDTIEWSSDYNAHHEWRLSDWAAFLVSLGHSRSGAQQGVTLWAVNFWYLGDQCKKGNVSSTAFTIVPVKASHRVTKPCFLAAEDPSLLLSVAFANSYGRISRHVRANVMNTRKVFAQWFFVGHDLH